MRIKPRVEIICPSLVSNHIGNLTLSAQIYPTSYYEANKDLLSYNWICFDLNISAPNVSISISNLNQALTNHHYTCSVQVLKNGVVELFNETKFLLIEFPKEYISANPPIIEDTFNQILVTIPMNDPNYDLKTFSWILAEVRNHTNVYGSINDTLTQLLKSNLLNYENENINASKSHVESLLAHNSNLMENTEYTNQLADSNLIPDELNILKGAFKYPFNLIFNKNAKFSGYSYSLLFISRNISGNTTIWPLKITIPSSLNNALIIPSNKAYVKDENVFLNIFNPGICNPNDLPLFYTLGRQDCPLTENNLQIPLISKINSFKEITLKSYLGNSNCNFMVRIFLTQFLGFTVLTNYADIYIAPSNYEDNPPSHFDHPPIDIDDSKSKIQNSSDIIINIYDPVAQMLEILKLEKNLFNSFNSTELEGKAETSAEYQKFNELLSLITPLIEEVMQNIEALKASKNADQITNQEYYTYDSAINLGIAIINDITDKGSSFINTTNKIELVTQLDSMAENIHSVRNVPQVSTLPEIIDNIFSESVNPNSNYTIDQMSNEQSSYINNVIKDLLGIYAISLTVDNTHVPSQSENMNSTIVRQSLSNYSENVQSFNISSNDEKFELSLPSSKELLEGIIESMKLPPSQTAIANYLFSLSNRSQLSNDPNLETIIQFSSKDQFYLNTSVELDTLNEQITNIFKDKNLRSKFGSTLRLGINIMISTIQKGSESSTGKWLSLCDMAGKSLEFSLKDESGPQGIKIPVFISTKGSISNLGMKVSKYDSTQNKISIQWTVPSCGKSRVLASSSSSVTVYAINDPRFIPNNINNSSLIGFVIKYTMLWLSISIIGAGIIFYIILSKLYIFSKREYIVKACSSKKQISNFLNKVPQDGCMKDIRIDRLRNIFSYSVEPKIYPVAMQFVKIEHSESISYHIQDDRSLNYLKENEEIIVDPNQFMEHEQTNLMATSICDFERETRSSSFWLYFLDEHIITGLFLGKNLRYPGQFKAADLLSSFLFLLFISGIFNILTTINFVLVALYSALCNLPLSLLSKKLLIGQVYNLKMNQDQINKILTINRRMVLVGLILNIFRSIGGIVGILLISMFKIDLFDSLMTWVYGFLVSLAIDLVGFELIKIFVQMIMIKMSKIKMQNGQTNFLRYLLAI